MAESLYGALIDRLDARLSHAADLARPHSPFVTLSYAQSLDGSIAAEAGKTLGLSNLHSQTLTHELRARHDAILVGINTVLADDPRLNVRLVNGRDPRPIVVDSRLRLPPDARLLRERRETGVIVATTADACPEKQARLISAGAQIVRLPSGPDGSVDLRALLRSLRHSGIGTLMVEGGARIITSILAARLADQLILTVCPVLVGGMRGVNKLPASSMPGLTNLHYASLEGDLIVMADLARPQPDQRARRNTPQALAVGGRD